MSASPPNVLWICTDQQRWDTLGAYGNDVLETPALDGLASEVRKTKSSVMTRRKASRTT